MLAESSVDQTIIKKIVEHSGAMTLTEKVFTHFDVKELVNAPLVGTRKKGHSQISLKMSYTYH